MSETRTAPRIAMVHAVYVAMAPVEAAFQRCWPQAQRVNLIDDALPQDLEAAGGMTPAMVQRITRLAEHAVQAGAQGLLFTCSAFGQAIEAAAAKMPVPVLKPNEAMFRAALAKGHRIGMLATYRPGVESLAAEFQVLAQRLQPGATLETHCIPEALAAARSGDIAVHNRLVAEAAPRLAHCDAIMLAHFSTSTALEAVQQALGREVLSAPDAAVLALKELLA
jgi:aspartate/glutamate racemase